MAKKPVARMPHTFTVVIEKAKRNYAAYCPELPGCGATAKTRAAVRERIKAAIRFHLDGLRRAGRTAPRVSL
jgi:predicted RNase H-like HicB family nuclease